MSETATFAAGCFWGVEATFQQVPGVLSTRVGYTGGQTVNPTYEQVCGKGTGHAEAVKVEFDPSVISYDQLLAVFFDNHDPTQLNRQGPDIGDQYRSAVFFHSPEQEAAAKAAIKTLSEARRFPGLIVTQVEAAPTFYDAEEYHQKYLEKRGMVACRA